MKNINLVYALMIASTTVNTTVSFGQVAKGGVKQQQPGSPMVVNPGKANDSMVVKPVVPNDDINRLMVVLSDSAFLQKTILDNRLALAQAALAIHKANSATVKNVATIIKNDHTAILDDLLKIQKKYRIEDAGITKLPPNALPANGDFDKTWAGNMLMTLQTRIVEMETFLGVTKHAQLKLVTMKAVSKMKKHRLMLAKIPGAKEKVKANRTRTI